MYKLVSDPEERARQVKRAKEDDEKVLRMLRAIHEAFIFTYEGEGDGTGRLSFVPSSNYNSPSLELRIFRAMKGHLWIDGSQSRLARVEGTLFEDVNFGWGILGHLDKGGTFRVEQKEVGDGHSDVVHGGAHHPLQDYQPQTKGKTHRIPTDARFHYPAAGFRNAA